MPETRRCGRCRAVLNPADEDLHPCACGGTKCSGFLCRAHWEEFGRCEGAPRRIPGFENQH